VNGLLINEVGTPVSSWCAVPFAFGNLGTALNETSIKTGNEMDTVGGVVGIEEPKRALVQDLNKSNPVEVFCFPPGLMFLTLGTRAHIPGGHIVNTLRAQTMCDHDVPTEICLITFKMSPAMGPPCCPLSH
jgi:hypothetical protein